MKVIQKLGLLLLSIASSVYPFIQKFHHLVKDDQHVYLLADMHINCPTDRDDRNRIIKQLISADNYREKIAFINETKWGNDFIYDRLGGRKLYKNEQNDFQGSLVLSHLAHQKPDLFVHDNLTFVPGDCRGMNMAYFLSGSHVGRRGRHYDGVDHDGLIEEFVKAERAIAGKIDFVGDANRADVEAYVAAREHLNLEVDEFGSIVKKADQREFNYNLVENLTDAYFYSCVCQALYDHAHNKVIMYAGQAHTDKVVEMLQKDGFVVESELDIRETAETADRFDFCWRSHIMDRYDAPSLISLDMWFDMFGFAANQEDCDNVLHGILSRKPITMHDVCSCLMTTGIVVGLCSGLALLENPDMIWQVLGMGGD